MTLMPALLWIIGFLFQQEAEIPFKPSEEFELKLNFEFKQRPHTDKYTVNFTESREEHEKRTNPTPLPYVIVSFKMLKLSGEEVRIRIVDNKGHSMMNRKAEVNKIHLLDLGFTDDLKDQTSSHEFNILLTSAKKKEISRIHLLVQEDGIFLVNGIQRGKF